jgi:hypothetical protein
MEYEAFSLIVTTLLVARPSVVRTQGGVVAAKNTRRGTGTLVKTSYLRAKAGRLSYTLAFALQLGKSHGKTCQSRIVPAGHDSVSRTGGRSCRDTCNTLGLRFRCVRLTLCQRKYLPSCRTKRFPASANLESKLSVRTAIPAPNIYIYICTHAHAHTHTSLCI